MDEPGGIAKKEDWAPAPPPLSSDMLAPAAVPTLGHSSHGHPVHLTNYQTPCILVARTIMNHTMRISCKYLRDTNSSQDLNSNNLTVLKLISLSSNNR